jgi:hypothetical protein
MAKEYRIHINDNRKKKAKDSKKIGKGVKNED